MYEKGEYVVCGHNGICFIEDIANPGFTDAQNHKMYYILEPLNMKGSKVYSPVDSKKVLMRPVMSEEEADRFIDKIPMVDVLWIGNEKMREERYKKAMLTCEPLEWVKIIKTLYLRKEDRLRQGKKITATDDRYLKLAEDSLYTELGFALGKDKSEMQDYIKVRIEKQGA